MCIHSLEKEDVALVGGAAAMRSTICFIIGLFEIPIQQWPFPGP